jgi:hypothetical protein
VDASTPSSLVTSVSVHARRLADVENESEPAPRPVKRLNTRTLTGSAPVNKRLLFFFSIQRVHQASQQLLRKSHMVDHSQ